MQFDAPRCKRQTYQQRYREGTKPEFGTDIFQDTVENFLSLVIFDLIIL